MNPPTGQGTALACHPAPCLRLQHEARGRTAGRAQGTVVTTERTYVVSQVLEPTGDAGKTYTLASWLPTVRISGNARPQTTLREDAITAFLGAYTLVALFWDGLRHNNLTGVDNFFSPPHIAMYLGLIGIGVWIAIVLLRYQKGLDVLDWSAVPRGYAARLRRAAAGGDRRPARLHLARGVRLREPDRLHLQPAAPGPLLLRRDAGRDPRRLGLAAPRGGALAARVPAGGLLGDLRGRGDAVRHPPDAAVLRRRRGGLAGLPGRHRRPRRRVLAGRRRRPHRGARAAPSRTTATRRSRITSSPPTPPSPASCCSRSR